MKRDIYIKARDIAQNIDNRNKTEDEWDRWKWIKVVQWNLSIKVTHGTVQKWP